jgi:uroporphyrinogen-III synthase
MNRPLQGRTVALAEGRQLEELAHMLDQEGAHVQRCPMISIVDAPDPAPVESWLREVIAGPMALLILMTGEAVRRLVGCAERAGLRDDFLAALARISTLIRGPKPAQALKEFGLAPTRIAQSPTTDGIIASLRDDKLAGQVVGVTRFGDVNVTLEDFLQSAGAIVRPVMPYVYAPGADEDRVAALIAALERGEIDVLVLTSSPQVDRLFEVADRRGLHGALAHGLQKTRVAAIGPIVADAMSRRQAPVHICPEQGFVMKNLVQHIKRVVAAGGDGPDQA